MELWNSLNRPTEWRAIVPLVSVLLMALTANAASGQIGPEQYSPASEKQRLAGSGEGRVAEQRPLGGASRQPRALGGSIVQTGVSLAIVLGLIVGCAAVFRKLGGMSGSLSSSLGAGGKSPAGILEILGRYPLSRGQTLVLLRVDGRVLLLSQAACGRLGMQSTLTTLCQISEPDDVASILAKVQDEDGRSMSAKFTELLTRFDEPGDESVYEDAVASGRSVRREESGDRLELLAPEAGPFRLEDVEARRAHSPADAVGSLRRRLNVLRSASS